MVLKPALEAIDIRFRKVQPTLYAVPMPAFLLRHNRLLCSLAATACGVSHPADRGMPRQIRLSTEDRRHFWLHYASRSVFPRPLPSALRDYRRHLSRPTFSFARMPGDALVRR